MKMKSKSYNFGHSADKVKQNRNFDFVNLYKSSTETSTSLSESHKISDNNDTEGYSVKSESPKRERSPNKRKKKEKRETIDVSLVTIDGPSLNASAGGSTPRIELKVTSTPLGNHKHQGKSSKVKSIMKNSSAVTDDAMDGAKLDTFPPKPKKRNKSVSFMLEDNEEVVSKKTKSNNSTSAALKLKVNKIKKQLKVKEDQHAEKENKINMNQTMDLDNSAKERGNKRSKIKPIKPNTLDASSVVLTGNNESSQSENVTETRKKKKKVKKFKKPEEIIDSKDSTTTENVSQEILGKNKKPKKKKYQEKPQTEPDNEEPVSKARKKEDKPDVISELENLSIGDNAHTLTNLLDDMTVVDKDKRKKLKQKFNKNKKPKGGKTEDSEKSEDIQDKVKWRRRKWNKDTKAEAKEGSLDTVLIVENLPLSLLFSYKKLLAEHFVKYGLIKTVGIAEVYPTEVSKPVFTTTINFYSDGAAAQALKEDNATFEGSKICVRRPLPATETTLVVRSYGTLSMQSLSSMFSGAGQIRHIRHLVKGKHAMATFFIEFDGPQTVERAMKLGTNTKIAGKKIYLSKFEVRIKKSKQGKTNDNEGSDADQSEDDSQD